MSTYKEIVGKKIKSLSSDPSDSADGQMWYNTTTQKLRALATSETTHSGTPMINKRSLYGFGVGTSTAGLVVGGIDDSTYLSVVEEWNGSGWAAGGAYPTARYSAGSAGTQTAAIAYCGRISPSPGPGSPTETYNYDGSSWTSGNSFPTGNNSCQGIGAVNTAVVSTQAYDSTAMHHWNGTSWTSANARNTAKGGQAAFGTQTAAILAGGYPSESNITEVYDGTNWTSGNTMNTGRNQIAGSGTQTDGLAFGGDKPPTEAAQTTIESWDGTSWATSPATLSTARSRSGAGRNTTSGTWIAGGIGPGGGGEGFDSVEIYTKSTNITTAAAWASGGTVPYTSRQNMSFGTQTAAIACGGYVSSTLDTSVSYNGTSYSSTPTLNVAARMGGVAGTQTAGIQFGGIQPPGTYNTNVQSWNGSAWSNNPYNLSTGTYGLMGCGTQTAALKVGGENPGGGNYTTSEEYDGEGWTAGGALPEAKYVAAGNGVQTSAIITGGSPSGTTTFEYNGSSWTAGGALATSRPGTQAGSAGATSDSNIVFGGGPALAVTEGYDGTSWSTRPSLATGRGSTNGNGIATAGLMVSGGPPSGTTTNTEEFTGETTSVNIKTFSSS